MRILHVYKTFFPDTYGGGEQFIATLAQAIGSLGYEQVLLTTSHKSARTTENRLGLTVERFPATWEVASCPFSYPLYQEFPRYVSWADIIHYHFPWPFADFLHLMHKVQKPAVITYHSDVVRQKYLKIFYNPMMKRFLRNANAIVLTSAPYLATSLDIAPFKSKCSVIPIGIFEKDYLPVESTRLALWRKKVGENFFFFVGALRYYKGLHYLLEAIAGTDIPLIIAGKGPCEKQLKDQAKRLGLKNVHFIGMVEDADKNALLQLCRAVVAPSHLRSEAFCITLAEGLLFGKPLICCEIGTGTSFVNQHNITGLVVPPADVVALRQALITLNTQEELVMRMGQAARKRYETLFTAQVMGSAYREIYDDLYKKYRNFCSGD